MYIKNLMFLPLIFMGCAGSNPQSSNTQVSTITRDFPVDFMDLVKKSEAFHQKFKIPNDRANRIKNIAKNDNKIADKIVEQAGDVRIIAHKQTKNLIQDFIAWKKKYGSNIEKSFYKTQTSISMFARLVQERPLAFLTGADSFLLRDGTKGNGGFDPIGTDAEKAPLVLKDYISYDEIGLAALLGVSVPTFFINEGDRFNKAKAASTENFQREGIYTGLVGARFEREDRMEWRQVMVTKTQNTIANGFGASADPNKAQSEFNMMWAKYLLGAGNLASFDEAKADITGRFIKISDEKYFDTLVYKERIKKVIVPFLFDANDRASSKNALAYCHVVGLGLGVWQVIPEQNTLFVEAFDEALKQFTFNNISDIRFSWLGKVAQMGTIKSGDKFSANGNDITILFGKDNPAKKLEGKDKDKLLVAMYAWDGNSYPGNEYYLGSLSASGDPAAASCSTISELQNPLINPQFLKNVSLFGN